MINENSTKEEVLKAVRQYGNTLKYASDKLRNDRDVVLEAVKQDEYTLLWASNELKNNKEFIMLVDKIIKWVKK